MSVLIKSMEMPKNCWECSLSDIDDDFGRCCLYSGIACLTIGRQDNCPLVEIPTPHGRLIDISTIEEIRFHDADGYHVVNGEQLCELEIEAKTIIKAEGSEK